MSKEKHYKFKLVLEFTLEAHSKEEAEEQGLECASDMIGEGCFDQCRVKVSSMTPEEVKAMKAKERGEARRAKAEGEKEDEIDRQEEQERLKNGIQPIIGSGVLARMKAAAE